MNVLGRGKMVEQEYPRTVWVRDLVNIVEHARDEVLQCQPTLYSQLRYPCRIRQHLSSTTLDERKLTFERCGKAQVDHRVNDLLDVLGMWRACARVDLGLGGGVVCGMARL